MQDLILHIQNKLAAINLSICLTQRKRLGKIHCLFDTFMDHCPDFFDSIRGM
jgi:hypothetical protein